MNDRDAALETFIYGAPHLIGLDVRPEWREAVKSNLVVALTYWERLRNVELPEDIEPAPVFTAFTDEGAS